MCLDVEKRENTHSLQKAYVKLCKPINIWLLGNVHTKRKRTDRKELEKKTQFNWKEKLNVRVYIQSENLCEIYIIHAYLNTHHQFFFLFRRKRFHLLLPDDNNNSMGWCNVHCAYSDKYFFNMRKKSTSGSWFPFTYLLSLRCVNWILYSFHILFYSTWNVSLKKCIHPYI